MKPTAALKAGLRKVLPLRVRSVPRRLVGRWLDHRRGIATEGWLSLGPDEQNRTAGRDGHMYQPVTYALLDAALQACPLHEQDVFVDLGCGKGRVCCHVASGAHIRRVIGVELVPQLADDARRNAALITQRAPVEIITGDVLLCNVWSEASVYFLYDPFGRETLARVLAEIRDHRTKPVRIICVNLPYPDLFHGSSWLTLQARVGERVFVWASRDDAAR